MKNRFLFSLIILGSLALWRGAAAYELHQEEVLAAARVAHLNTPSLNLKDIVRQVDELGGNTQLNWKEVVAIVAVLQNNQVAALSPQYMKDVAECFLAGSPIAAFEEVAASFLPLHSDRKLAHQYLKDLAFVGYVPQRLHPDAPEAQFIAKLTPLAKRNHSVTGILPSITIAQAILESSWGDSELAANSNNLFGIKADSRWDGTVATFKTREYSGRYVDAKFREYGDWYESIEDHGEFLTSNARYAEAGLFEATTYRSQSLALQAAGYSTVTDAEGNPIYAQRLQELIRQYNLQLLDVEVLRP